MVTGQWVCSHCWQLPPARGLHSWPTLLLLLLYWWQLKMVTTPSVSSHCASIRRPLSRYVAIRKGVALWSLSIQINVDFWSPDCVCSYTVHHWSKSTSVLCVACARQLVCCASLTAASRTTLWAHFCYWFMPVLTRCCFQNVQHTCSLWCELYTALAGLCMSTMT